MLHGVGRGGAKGRLRHAGQAGGRSLGHHPGGSRAGRAPMLGRGVLRHRGEPVWVLHPRHRHAPGRAATARRRSSRRGIGRAGARRTPLPVHGVAHYLRRSPAGGRSRQRSDAWSGRRRRRPQGRPRGWEPADGGPRRAARRGWLRRRHGPRRRPGRRARRRRRLGRGRDAPRGSGGCRQGAGATQPGPAGPPAGGAARGVAVDPAHDVGRAGLPRDRRLVVPTRGRARHTARRSGSSRAASSASSTTTWRTRSAARRSGW